MAHDENRARSLARYKLSSLSGPKNVTVSKEVVLNMHGNSSI